MSPLIVESGFSIDWLLSQPIAHRGYHTDTIPENSLASFEKACELGLSIELDVHLLKDGEVVVFHDVTLERMTGVKGKISSCDSKMLKDLKLLESDEHVPLLKEVLDLVKDRVPIVLEIKNTNYTGTLEDAVCSLLNSYTGRVTIQSFNPLSLIHCKKKAPNRPRGILTSASYEGIALYKKWLLNTYLLLPRVRPSYIGHQFESLDLLSLKIFRNLKLLPILAWTIKSESDRQLVMGRCDNIIFEAIDYPFK
ncbi:MAG: hypothetical protein KC493_13545 [Bacteriovoracaceae bacterium]|nr:hypothetical protein [Bacteriovoracaceae bacterium]